jgi:RHH-type transcriptional regulator, rel operon repressor / antitoxin RelB
MPKTALMSVRMPGRLAERLENLAKATDRSKSYLAALAIEEFVAVQEWQVQAIQEGMAEAEGGKVVDHDKALKELKKWGKK